METPAYLRWMASVSNLVAQNVSVDNKPTPVPVHSLHELAYLPYLIALNAPRSRLAYFREHAALQWGYLLSVMRGSPPWSHFRHS